MSEANNKDAGTAPAQQPEQKSSADQKSAADPKAAKPSIGRILHYSLSELDVARIRAAVGFNVNFCEPHRTGDILPLIVTDVVGKSDDGHVLVSGQVLLNGTFSHYARSVREGKAPGTWQWPSRT